MGSIRSLNKSSNKLSKHFFECKDLFKLCLLERKSHLPDHYQLYRMPSKVPCISVKDIYADKFFKDDIGDIGVH